MVEQKSCDVRCLKFRSGGNLRGFPRRLNFVISFVFVRIRFRAMYKARFMTAGRTTKLVVRPAGS